MDKGAKDIMIWLASFPRSGNTFFRIILHEVYGVTSSEYHMEKRYPVDPDYADYPIVKTHLLPNLLIPNDPNIPAVYLVRDGRDALVSMAHHRKDIIAPGSNFEVNLQKAILAKQGSFFGGWSRNVSEWLKLASLVIRFEDLIEHPLECTERLRAIMDLPEPKIEQLPTFEDLREKPMPYNQKNISQEARDQWRKNFFRRGKVGAWKDEMPYELHEVFWERHGAMMERLGYEKELYLSIPRQHLGFHAKRHIIRIGKTLRYEKGKKMCTKKVLIEASEIMMGSNDGCQRYIIELLRGLQHVIQQLNCPWEIDVHLGMRSIFPLQNIEALLQSRSFTPSSQTNSSKKSTQKFTILRGIQRIKSSLINTIETVFPDTVVNVLQEWNRALQTFLWTRIKSVNFNQYDLVHLPLPQFFYTLTDCHTKLVTTVHDLSHRHYPEFHVKNIIVCTEKGMQFALERQSAFIAISKATKQDILREYHHVNAQDVYTIYEGYSPQMFYPVTNPEQLRAVRQKYRIPAAPYLLSLCTLEPRKNLVNTIKAFLLLLKELPENDVVLVLAGKKGWKYQELFQEQAEHSERVFLPGFIAEEDLAALYSGALALSYVSYYEGFGLPLLEAMSCGTPVIYGNNSSMPEVAGDGGLPADPDNIEDIKEQFKRIVLNEEQRTGLAERALHQAQKFSWEKTVHDTLKVYNQVLMRQMD